MQEMTINPHDYRGLEEACRELAEKHDPRTFTQAVIDRMYPRPLQPYGSAVWCVGRMSVMYATGLLH